MDSWQERETFDELDGYLDGDWRAESIKQANLELDGFLSATSPKTLTWQDFKKFIEDHHINQDEYFFLHTEANPKDGIWLPNTLNVIIWLAEGSNEGYVVTVETLERQAPHTLTRTLRASGKFWSIEAGQRAVNLLTRFVNDWPLI